MSIQISVMSFKNKKMRKIRIVATLLLVFLFSKINLFGQEKSEKILQKKVLDAKNQKLKVDAINELGDYWFDKNYDSATFYYKKANQISNSIHYKKGVFDYASNYGNVCMYKGDYEELIKLMKLSVQKSKEFKDKHNEAKFTANLGNAYMSNAEYEKALPYFQKGIELFKKNKEHDFERKINLMISVCFSNSGNQDKAIEYSKLALQQSEIAKDSATVCKSLEITGSNYLEKNEFINAKPFLERALQLAKKHNYQDEIANCHYYLSRVFHFEKNYPKAIALVEKALEYFTETGNDFYKINSLTFLSIYLKDSKKYSQALKYLKEAEQLAQKNNMKSHLLLVYTNMALLHKETENYKDAYLYLEKHDILNDSLNSINLKNQLQDLDIKYQTDKKQLQIKTLTQQNELQDLKIKRRLWTTITLLLALLGLAIFAYSQYKNFKTKKALLVAQQDNAVAEERLRIASDMHDDVGSGLSRIRYIVGAIANGQTEQKQGLIKVTEISDDAVQKMKEIIWSLNESNQNLEDLIYYIRGQMSEMVQNGNVNFVCHLPKNIPSVFFGWKRNRNTYLLVKEAINNALKHAEAKTITLDFIISNNLKIKVTDDGKGFDTTKNFTGNGLNNYKKRIADLNASYILKSEIDKGTTFWFQLPIEVS